MYTLFSIYTYTGMDSESYTNVVSIIYHKWVINCHTSGRDLSRWRMSEYTHVSFPKWECIHESSCHTYVKNCLHIQVNNRMWHIFSQQIYHTQKNLVHVVVSPKKECIDMYLCDSFNYMCDMMIHECTRT